MNGSGSIGIFGDHPHFLQFPRLQGIRSYFLPGRVTIGARPGPDPQGNYLPFVELGRYGNAQGLYFGWEVVVEVGIIMIVGVIWNNVRLIKCVFSYIFSVDVYVERMRVNRLGRTQADIAEEGKLLAMIEDLHVVR